MKFVNVAIPAPVHHTFTYLIDEGAKPLPGMRLKVPFHGRSVVGICIDRTASPPDGVDEKKVRPIVEVLDKVPSLNSSIIALMKWMSSYYLAPIGEICRCALPSRLMRLASPVTTRPKEPHETTPLNEISIVHNEHQKNALRILMESFDSNRAEAFLLHGITGSGKTEVYLSFFDHVVKKKKRCLLLVPEIGLTPLLTGRAAARFGSRIAVYHSGLTDAQRHEQWMRIRRGDADVVIGTRSALFAPIDDLGAIVVDEEHDGSYKQDEGFLYNARDSAVMRAHIEKVPIILGSATPSLESFSNTKSGKYKIISLPIRTAGASLPSIEIVDMRTGKGACELECLSKELFDAVTKNLDAGRQTLLYAGRRGFASAVQCTACGGVITCPNCDIALTLHGAIRGQDYLSCHYCDFKSKAGESCPICFEKELISLGMGTERLEAEITDFFPKARVARLDSDVLAKPKERKKIFSAMRNGELDILIGTQIVTKGHDFPNITLVGVVSADVTLALPDFRAPERMFQLITQVSGRAGRGNQFGRVIIQTRQPEHYSLASAAEHDFEGFAEKELSHRSAAGYPPFTRLANIRISSNSKTTVSEAANSLRKVIEKFIKAWGVKEIVVLGPAPAIIEKLRGKYRWQILIKTKSSTSMSNFLGNFYPKIRAMVQKGAGMSIDIDPMNMF